MLSHWSQRLYERKATELILYGRALNLTHAEAEDVLQETFLALLEKSEAPLQPEYYCLRSFRNRALNYRRSLWRRLVREWESLSWFEPASVQSEAEEAAARCLTLLPQPQREVIVLKIWHRYTFEEIGDLLSISPNTAAGRYRYGIKTLRCQMKGALNERDDLIGNPLKLLETASTFPRH
jgi:RNA polymerase sigma-70 factor (ECF subfamily)